MKQNPGGSHVQSTIYKGIKVIAKSKPVGQWTHFVSPGIVDIISELVGQSRRKNNGRIILGNVPSNHKWPKRRESVAGPRKKE